MESGEPLFPTYDEGGPKNKTNGIIIALNVLLVIFELFTVAVCVAFGIIKKSPEHFVMGAVAISIFAAFATLMWWYRKGLLEEGRFKFLIVLVLLGVLFASIAANMYVWKPLPVPENCQNSGFYFSISSQTCFQIFDIDSCVNRVKGLCIEAIPGDTINPTKLVCRNCTTPPNPLKKRGVQEPIKLNNIQAKRNVEEAMGKVQDGRVVEGVMGKVQSGRGVMGTTVTKRGVKEIDTEGNAGMKKVHS